MYYFFALCMIAIITFFVVYSLGFVEKAEKSIKNQKHLRKANLELDKKYWDKKLEKEIKITGSMNTQALRFEFSEISCIVEEVIKNMGYENPNICDLYLIRLYEELEKMKSLKSLEESGLTKISDINKLACFYKVLLDEPLVLFSSKDAIILKENVEIINQVLEKGMKRIILDKSKSEYIKWYMNNYYITRYEIYLLGFYLVDKYM